MSVFTDHELDYLCSRVLCRLATAASDGRPHVVPVTYRYDAATDAIDIGGHGFAKRKKWRDVGVNPWVAVVVDDILSTHPWQVRMLEVRGQAECLQEGRTAIGRHVDEEMFRIHPRRIRNVGWRGRV